MKPELRKSNLPPQDDDFVTPPGPFIVAAGITVSALCLAALVPISVLSWGVRKLGRGIGWRPDKPSAVATLPVQPPIKPVGPAA